MWEPKTPAAENEEDFRQTLNAISRTTGPATPQARKIQAWKTLRCWRCGARRCAAFKRRGSQSARHAVQIAVTALSDRTASGGVPVRSQKEKRHHKGRNRSFRSKLAVELAPCLCCSAAAFGPWTRKRRASNGGRKRASQAANCWKAPTAAWKVRMAVRMVCATKRARDHTAGACSP